MKFRIHKHAAQLAETILTDNGRDGYELEAKPEEFWFVLVGANGEIVATSEMYTRKQAALDTISSIISAFATAGGSMPIEDTTIRAVSPAS